MNEIWVNRLIAGTRLFSEVPVSRKVAVKTILIDKVIHQVISKEQYENITNEPYEN